MNVHTERPFKTKKALREKVNGTTDPTGLKLVGKPIPCYTESLFHSGIPNGRAVCVGPTSTIRKWYAEVEVKDGHIVKVLK